MTKSRKIIYFLSLILFLSVWETLFRLGLLNPILFSSPSMIFITFYEMTFIKHTLLVHTSVSLIRVIVGCILGSFIGIILGIIIGRSIFFEYLLQPYIDIIYPIPKIAWIPLAILWFGLGNQATIFIISFAAFWPTLLATISGIKQADKKYVKVAKTFEADRKFLLFHVLLPAAFPYIITGLRIGVGQSWRALVAAEMLIVTAQGLGYMIFASRVFLNTEQIFLGMFIIGLVGALTENLLFKPLEKNTLIKWGMINPT